MRRTIAMAAGLSLALGAVPLAGADDDFGAPRMDEPRVTFTGGEPAFGKDPRQLTPSENPLKGMPGEMRESALPDTGAAPPEYGKDPRQLLPGENPLKGIPRVKDVER